MTDARLFDPAPYTKGRPREERTRRPRVESDAVTITEPGWIAIARNGKPPCPELHRVRDTNPHGSVRTNCGITARPIDEVRVGVSARLCSKCAASHD